jgi:hypothetical protein
MANYHTFVLFFGKAIQAVSVIVSHLKIQATHGLYGFTKEKYKSVIVRLKSVIVRLKSVIVRLKSVIVRLKSVLFNLTITLLYFSLVKPYRPCVA